MLRLIMSLFIVLRETVEEASKHHLPIIYATSARFEQALTAHIRGIKPTASVDFNYHGNPPFS